MAAVLLGGLGMVAGFLLIRRVPTAPPATWSAKESVSVIIPARDEEKNLPRLLESIAGSAARPAEVLVVDDGSTDGTAAVAASRGARVLKLEERPAGWTGKSWACYRGAQCARGEVLLFLDADTYFLPGGLERLAARWCQERDERLVLSMLPYHAMEAAWEQLSLFFHVLMAAGAGGFGRVAGPRLFGPSLVISRELYFEAGGHAAVRGVVLENLRWASRLSECGARMLCLGGEGTLHTRMFPEGFGQMTESWAKGLPQGAGDSGGMVLGVAIVWISALWSTAWRLAVPGDAGHMSTAVVYGVLSLQMAWMARQLGRYRVLSCLLYPLPLVYYCLVFAGAAVRRALGGKAAWRGREV